MHSEKIDGFSQKSNAALQGGGQERIDAQHNKGKLTARERIHLLLDEGTFTEIDPLTTHHYHEYDMQKKKFFTDGVIGPWRGGRKGPETFGTLSGHRRPDNPRTSFSIRTVLGHPDTPFRKATDSFPG